MLASNAKVFSGSNVGTVEAMGIGRLYMYLCAAYALPRKRREERT